jgi:hypothetical protein
MHRLILHLDFRKLEFSRDNNTVVMMNNENKRPWNQIHKCGLCYRIEKSMNRFIFILEINFRPANK